MSVQSEIDRLRAFLVEAINTSIVVVAGKGRDPASLSVQRLSLHEDVAREFKDAMTKVLPAEDAGTLYKKYQAGYKPDQHELQHIKIDGSETMEGIVTLVSNINQAEAFSERDDIIDSLRFYVVIISSTPEEGALFFRSYSSKKELSRKSGFALMLQKGAYNRVQEKVFLFDDDVDCFAWNGSVYIRIVSSFLRIFGYYEKLRQRADQTVDEVAGKIPISNLDDFRAACLGHPQMMAKLAQIADKPYLNKLSFHDIKKTIAAFDLDVATVVEDGQDKLVFESSPQKRWQILKLLDDDYLGSQMTDEKYEVNSKSSVR